MRVAKEQIHELTESVWHSMLGMPIAASDAQSDAIAREVLTACVHITGTWNGVVTLGCSPAFAQRAAGAMFDCAPESASHEEVHDALGELANMVGGNLKGLLPGSCQLSLPAVAAGELAWPGSSLVEEAWFDCSGEALVVRVLARGESVRHHAPKF
jgi:chemotaxis protein CheX